MTDTGKDKDAHGEKVRQDLPDTDCGEKPEQEQNAQKRINGGRKDVGDRIGAAVKHSKAKYVIDGSAAEGHGDESIAGQELDEEGVGVAKAFE